MKQIRSLSLLAGAVLYLCALAPPALAAPFLPFPPEFKGGNGNFVVGQAIDVKWAVTGSYDSCAPLQYQPAGVHGYKTMPATMVWTSSPANGELKGVFNETGTYEFIVSMSCSLVGGGSATQSGNYYAFVTQPPQPLSMINGPFLPACNVGVPFWHAPAMPVDF